MMTLEIFAIYSCGGYAREVLPLLREQLPPLDHQQRSELVFLDDFVQKSYVNGIRVLTLSSLLDEVDASRVQCSIAVSDGQVRESLTLKCADLGIKLMTVKAANAIVMDDVDLGEGSILSPFVTLTSNISIGKSFHCNLYSYVGHDCVIGDYVTFAPGVKCNGNVHIGSGAYFGAGAVILPGTANQPMVIGEGAVIGAGAVVTRSVPPNSTVVGNPARLLQR